MSQLDPSEFQVSVAHVFFSLNVSQQYVVAGGAGLLARELINRPTQDLDFFTHVPSDSVTEARDALVHALDERGLVANPLVDTPTFCRIYVSSADGTDPEEVLVDLAIDSPPTSPPTMTILGPTLAPLELAGRKLLALFGRAEARDFADVFVLAQRFGTATLLTEAATGDAGFDQQVLADMMRTLDRFTDEEIPLPSRSVTEARTFFKTWAAELA